MPDNLRNSSIKRATGCAVAAVSEMGTAMSCVRIESGSTCVGYYVTTSRTKNRRPSDGKTAAFAFGDEVGVRQLFVADQHRPAAQAIGRTDDAFVFHPLDQAGGPVVADPQPPLEHRRRRGSLLPDDVHRLIPEGIVFAAPVVAFAAGRQIEPFRRIVRHGRDAMPVIDDVLNVA